MVGIVVDDRHGRWRLRRLGLDIQPEADGQPHVDITLPGGMRLDWDTIGTIRSFDPDGRRRAEAVESSWHSDLIPRPTSIGPTRRITGAGYRSHQPPGRLLGQRYAIVLDPRQSIDLFADAG